MKKRIIGSNTISYASERNFFSLNYSKYKCKKTIDLFKILHALNFKIFKKTNKYFLNLYMDFGINKVDLFHFFNGVYVNDRTPWIVTYETILPRYAVSDDSFDKAIRFGIKQLAKQNCKKIIALSENAYNIQKQYLDFFPEYKEDIINKMCIIHPPQELLISNYEEKELDADFLNFTIVGSEFFRKGGKEILAAFDKMLTKNKFIKLNIISNLVYGDYASKSTKEDYIYALKIISKYPKNIFHYNGLPNQEVLKILRNTHVALLPTYDDSYGYSVLEAQACACPVVTTNVRALPEINNNDAGWIISVSLDERRRGYPKNKDQKEKFSKILEESLYTIIDDICKNPQIIKEKGMKSLNRIRKFHDPLAKTKEIESIYDDALGG